MVKKIFEDKRILFMYLITILLLIIGTTYALQSTSSGIFANTAIVRIDEESYGSSTFDTTSLKPILDKDVESSDNIIHIDFTVGGDKNNNRDNIIYDIALTDLNVNCDLLSPYIKWKLVKNGEELSTGSLDYHFDTIIDGRLVLTTIQEDLPTYNENQQGYDKYNFYMWISDSCQSDNLIDCLNNPIDQSELLNKNLSGKIEVELYTDSKKELVRRPTNELDINLCLDKYLVEYDFTGGTSSEKSKFVNTNSPYGDLPVPTKKAAAITYDTGYETKIDSDIINYTFAGWYLSNQYKTDELVTKDTIVKHSKNHKIYAKWNGTSTVTLPTLTRTGYTFEGWYSDKEYTTKVEGEYTTTIDITLYAKWNINSYKLNINPNGGTWNNDASAQEFTGDYNTTKIIEVPTEKPYYTINYDVNGGTSGTPSSTKAYREFTGWTLTGGGSITNNTPISTSPQTYTYGAEGGTLTANYSATAKGITLPSASRSYTLTYNLNGGSLPSGIGTTSQVNYTFNGWYTSSTGGTHIDSEYEATTSTTMYAQWTSASTTLPTPAKTGYTFNGWYTAASGGNKIANGGENYTPTSNTSLYAQWTANTYTINFNGNGATSGSVSSKACTYDGNCSTADRGFVRTGYNFAGWTTNSNGTDDGYNWSNWTGKWTYDNGQYGINNKTLTLYARWTLKTVNVKFMRNYNSSDTTSVTKTYTYGVSGQAFNSEFTRTGYTGSGWATSSGGSQVYTFTNGISNAWIDSNGGTTVTLYAKWTANTYTISFSGNGNTGGSTGTKTCTYDQNCVLTSNGFSKTGYNFGGWTYGSSTYNNGATVKNLATSGSITFTAKWNRNFTCASAGSNTNYMGKTWYTISNSGGVCDLALNATVGNSGGNTYNASTGTGSGSVYSFISSYSNGTNTIAQEYSAGLITTVDSASNTNAGLNGVYWRSSGTIYDSFARNAYLCTNTGTYAGQFYNSDGTIGMLTRNGITVGCFSTPSSSSLVAGNRSNSNANSTLLIPNGQYSSASVGNRSLYFTSFYPNPDKFTSASASTVCLQRSYYNYSASGTASLMTYNQTIPLPNTSLVSDASICNQKTVNVYICGGSNHGNYVQFSANSTTRFKYHNYATGTDNNLYYDCTKSDNNHCRIIDVAGRAASTTSGTTRTYRNDTGGYCSSMTQYTISNLSVPVYYRPHIKVKI